MIFDEVNRMACLQGADILLPASGIDMEKWAVIACDQFTSQPEYWRQAEDLVGDAPSTLFMVYPEVYLGSDDEQGYRNRIRKIQRYMKNCLAEGVLTERVHRGYVLTARETRAGVRVGLIAALDLESYDYSRGTSSKVRATEATVQSRIPVRVGIRRGAPIELPHVMMLLDDKRSWLLESFYERREDFPKLYDTELMLGGGHVSGYALEGKTAEKLTEALERLEQDSGDIFLAVGDGNHSLAAAKACWESAKGELSPEERENHPARYALVEVVNIHDSALVFHPIHRVVSGVKPEAVVREFAEYLGRRGICWSKMREKNAADITFLQGEAPVCIRFADTEGHLAVEILQSFLDEYLEEHSEAKIDYVHSEEAVRNLAENRETCGILLGAIDKSLLFPAIAAGGVLPRKTFSIGEDCQKRYYIECRRLS